ncbi:major facilitator superfamily domain-containing protein [Aspergillus karnatakaensis]|uniref:major facilitator superfamily domain-containing protein n=1 Tax=Aspergillus karnatakaensis TaxID=1810916 RepID=UPI003CCDB153
MDSNRNSDEHHDSVHHEAARRGLRKTNSKTMEWDTEHQDFPRNWSMQRKIYDGTICFFLEFFTTVISSTGPSAAEEAMTEYGLSRVVCLTGFQFMYGMGQALGGLVMPPFSEALGRRMSYLVSAAAFVIGCILVGVVSSPAGVFIGRFISGWAASVPAIVLAGSIEDQYTARPRLWMLWLWNCCTILGISAGPIYGSYIVDAIGWRWVYHIAAITCAVVFVLMIPIRESRSTTLLARRFQDLQSKVGELDMEIPNPDHIGSARELIQVILIRPAKLGVTEPIIMLVASLSASVWGMMYLFTESFTVVYSGFGFSSRATALPFIAILPGIFASGLTRLWDYHRLKKREEAGESPEPEDKIGGFAIAAPALAIGLWIFGWTVPPRVHVHWIASMFGLFPIGFAATEFSYTLSGYIADAYTIYASSGMAVVAFLRGIASACMPLFAYPMYSGLGSNVATSIIAAIATAFCFTPFVFLRFGKQLRERSRFARYSAEMNEKHGAD